MLIVMAITACIGSIYNDILSFKRIFMTEVPKQYVLINKNLIKSLSWLFIRYHMLFLSHQAHQRSSTKNPQSWASLNPQWAHLPFAYLLALVRTIHGCACKSMCCSEMFCTFLCTAANHLTTHISPTWKYTDLGNAFPEIRIALYDSCSRGIHRLTWCR